MDPPATRRILGVLEWPRQVSVAERRSLLAGGLGWMLDAMDVTLYALVLIEVRERFALSDSEAGWIASASFIASAVGGALFGLVADRIGRTRALLASILVYSLASGACGFASGFWSLALFRVVLGLGMGGEWSTGATLIAETWRPEHRAKALGLMQSSWAVGEALAAGVAAAVGLLALRSAWLSENSWRVVFLVGVAPALLCFWIRRRVPEPEIWRGRSGPARVPLHRLLEPGVRRHAVIATLMNAASMFGYWGLFTWIPAYLKRPEAEGGRGLALLASTGWFLWMCGGKFLGYLLFGFLSDRFGRRRCYFGYLLLAALLLPLFAHAESTVALLVLGPLVAFFGTGFFSGFGALASELFPTAVRATALGLTYNLGRGLSALAPWAVGAISVEVGRSAPERGLAVAFVVLAGMYLLAALLSLALPDSRGRPLA